MNQTLRNRLDLSRRRRPLLALTAILVLMLSTRVLQAATYTVSAGNVAELINAIYNANANQEADTIILAAGTYTLTEADNDTEGSNGLPSITSPITILGAGPDSTVIIRDALADSFRPVHVAASGVLTLSGLSIAGGDSASSGSGIRNAGFLSLSHCIVRDNDGEGGIANVDGVMVMTQCEVHNNSHNSFCGGGVLNEGGVTTIAQSTIYDNFSDTNAGGLCNETGSLFLLQSTVRGNGTEGAGGGILNHGVMYIADSTVSDNRITEIFPGGGVFNSGELNISNSTISRNQSHRGGGGIHNSGQLTVRSSTVTENQAQGDTGDIQGGGIWNNGGTVTLVQTIVAGNTLTEYPDGNSPTRISPSDCAGRMTSRGYNLVGRRTGCPRNGGGDQSVVPDQVFATVLGPLQLNGGPTETHALLPDSPAIDAVPAASCLFHRDQRGNPRPADGNRDGVDACDVGAVELSNSESVSCEELFGDAPGYQLCEETAVTCGFNATTNGGTCDEMCLSLGSRCVGTLDNDGNSCNVIPGSNDTCQTPRQTAICICER